MGDEALDAGGQAAPSLEPGTASNDGGEPESGKDGAGEGEGNPEDGAVGDGPKGDDGEERFDYGVHGMLTRQEAEQRMWMQPHFTQEMQKVRDMERALAERETALAEKEKATQANPPAAQDFDPQELLKNLEGDALHEPLSKLVSKTVLQQKSMDSLTHKLTAMEKAYDAI
ncbi:MAG TPA: hypothetical protein PKM88_07540, partial [bacterium]|nr:hypothetical protein [bacterium]